MPESFRDKCARYFNKNYWIQTNSEPETCPEKHCKNVTAKNKQKSEELDANNQM